MHGPAAMHTMVKGFNVCLSEPLNRAMPVVANSRQVYSYWKGRGRGESQVRRGTVQCHRSRALKRK